MTQIVSAAQKTGETSSQQVLEVTLSGAGGDAKATVVGKEMDLLQLEEMLHRGKFPHVVRSPAPRPAVFQMMSAMTQRQAREGRGELGR